MTGGSNTRRSAGGRADRSRAQSHVVGAALLLGLTVIALAGITAAVGGIVEDQTGRADAARVADDFDDALRPVETTGHRTGAVRFTAGQLGVRGRQLRVHNSTNVTAVVQTDALVFEGDGRRVASVAGGTVNGVPGNALLERDPPISVGPDVVVVGAVMLNGSGGVGGSGGVTAPLHTNVSHKRVALGNETFTVSVETATPEPFERYGTDLGAETAVEDLDGDGVPSVRMTFPGDRQGYLVVHDMRLEVGHG